MIFQHRCYSAYAKFYFNYISLLFHQCILWILLIIIMEGMIINECVIAFTLRMNIWERLKL
ncbi:hypothetical protein OIU92_23000 [Escherichia coli]|nr:hypothetical protein [Escherichia coli]